MLTKLELLYVTCEDDHPFIHQLHCVPGVNLLPGRTGACSSSQQL